ncbi:hypothetical protein QTP88_006284 [Uroleucon formosanum]
MCWVLRHSIEKLLNEELKSPSSSSVIEVGCGDDGVAVAATAAVIAAVAAAATLDAVPHNRWGSILVATCHAPPPPPSMTTPPPPPAPPPRPQPQKTHVVCQSVAYVRRRPVRLSCPSVCPHVSVAVAVRSFVRPFAASTSHPVTAVVYLQIVFFSVLVIAVVAFELSQYRHPSSPFKPVCRKRDVTCSSSDRFMHSLSVFPFCDASNVDRSATAPESYDRRTRFRLRRDRFQRPVVIFNGKFSGAPFLPRNALRAASSNIIML